MTASQEAAPLSAYRRNVIVLAVAQALFMCTQSMGIATTPLAGHSLLGVDKSLATLPIFLNHAGIMLTTIPASLLMGRIGRKAGFTIGAVLAIVFGLLAAYAVLIRSFELLCVSALLQGSAAAFAWYYRFAAADASPDDFKPKAISYVMAGGIAAGFIGPQIAKWTVDWFAPVAFTFDWLMFFSDASKVITLARPLARKTITIRATTRAPSRSAVVVLRIEFWMKSACRKMSVLSFIPAGSCEAISARVASSRFVNSIVLAPGCFWMPRRTAGRPIAEPSPRFCAAPTVTSPRSRKNRSTMFSQDALVGVKWKWNRGFRAAHALTFGCLCVA